MQFIFNTYMKNRNNITNSTQLENLSPKTLTIPNLLTILRILLLPVLRHSLNIRETAGYTLAIVVGSIMIISDILDGLIARYLHQCSFYGSIMDPVTDKIIINSLAIYFFFTGELPWWIGAFLVFRDTLIVIFGTDMIFRKKITPLPVSYGRIAPLFWGLSYILLVSNMKSIAWSFIIIALALSFISAIFYFVRYVRLPSSIENISSVKSQEEINQSKFMEN